jgi:hypothetical protein
MKDMVELTSGLDQVVPLLDMEKVVFDKIDEATQKAFLEGSMEPVWSMGLGLSAVGKASGLGLAKLLYNGEKMWKELTGQTDKEYYEEAFVKIGKHKQTVIRYCAIWKMFDECVVPGEYVDRLYALGVKMLSPIAQCVKEGYEIPSNKWLALAECVDEAEVRTIIKKIKGKEDNSNNKTRFIDRDGDYVLWMNEKKYNIGHFNVDEDDEIVKAEITRAISLLGLMEK